ncbi:unnamed protein product [Cyprideis torosa]|uniref:MICOS complex subunit MIC10 n=1 Tax=Cyprideis torosa TaxID=163714 RepID=A0A7R8VZV2_9CRUS|nr:unnamed protein product [Cyprideis torosa]CAG0879044.1 unnamed protein product [Cyprideis torosa]
MTKGETVSEKELGEKIGLCLSDALVKFGGGIALGGIFSLVVFKRKMWPVTFGGAFGLGMAYSNCQNALNQPYMIDKRRVKVIS